MNGGRAGSLVIWALLLALPAQADFTLASQNALHLGWGDSKGAAWVTAKYQYLRNQIIANYDVTLVQEVMGKAAVASMNLPATHNAFPPAGTPWTLKGYSSYKESYLLVANGNNVNVICQHYYQYPNEMDAGLPVKTFIRSPDIALVKTPAAVNPTWLINYHALWGGSSKVPRVAEARALKRWVQNTLIAQTPNTTVAGCPAALGIVNRVVIGADWNLEQGEVLQIFQEAPAFGGVSVTPNTNTTIGSKAPFNLSSGYDHFVFINIVTAAGGNPVGALIPLNAPFNTNQLHRQGFSDHRGISVTVPE
jgi:hypothetical protein